MKSPGSSNHTKPFQHLKILIENKQIELKRQQQTTKKTDHKPSFQSQKTDPSSSTDERRLFLEAMSGVIPIGNRKTSTPKNNKTSSPFLQNDPDKEALHDLNNLLRTGSGFYISMTPEYVEGISGNTHPEVVKRLHRGDFSIQDYIDLHGFGVIEAQLALDRFLKQSIVHNKRIVLIVHGRGLSSPRDPILKNKVISWLTNGKWKKWISAFTSARKCDGGAGATYVMLRYQPLTKRLLKQNMIRRTI